MEREGFYPSQFVSGFLERVMSDGGFHLYPYKFFVFVLPRVMYVTQDTAGAVFQSPSY